LGIRRLALAEAMLARAREVGANVRERCAVVGHRVHGSGVTISTESGDVHASLLVGADGLSSPLRRAAGLDQSSSGPRRFGLRQHFLLPPWSPFVEVHFSPGIEAYVTPVGKGRVCVAFLWEDGRVHASNDVAAMLERFPALRARLVGAPVDSRPIGAGPLERRPRARTARRFALLGDAAGSVDALTGDGVSLALMGAAALANELPAALQENGVGAALARYDRAVGNACAPYVRLARLLLFVARRPALRRLVVRGLARAPLIFERVLASHASARRT
jgi:flavin-dependent dehydrogenase